MPVLTRSAAILAVSALLTLGGCSKKEPAATDAPVPAATTAEPAPATSAETSPAAAEPAAAMETAPTAPTSPVVEAPAAAPAEAATPATPPAAVEPAPAPPTAQTSAAPPVPAETVAAAAPAKPIDGAAIAQGICVACHGSGMNGAPKLQNKIAWAPRIAQGRETVYQHALKGLRGMPPRGGNPSLSDDEVKAAVDYMVKLAGGWKD
jgi:cytochrome c5